jgi:pimeloyl-ACP methyl ester carboxylesterase
MVFSDRKRIDSEPILFQAKKQAFIKRPDGSKINVCYFGNEKGISILFVHGLNANSMNWFYQIKYFEKNYRVVTMDLAGMGNSELPKDKNISLDRIAYDVKMVVDHLNVKDVILWGHSMGGMAILTLLAKGLVGAEQVKAAVLQHTTYTNPVKTMQYRKLMTVIQKPILIPLCSLMIFLSPVLWLTGWLSYLNGHAHLINRFLTFAGTQTPLQLNFSTRLSAMTKPAVTARGCLAMFGYDVSEDLTKIKIPVMIVAANFDRLTQPDAGVHMKQNIVLAELATIAPANHQGLIERHEEVNEAVYKFLNKLN